MLTRSRVAQCLLAVSLICAAASSSRAQTQDFFYHADDLHNVTAITNTSGTVVENYEYDDYGRPLNSTSLQPAASSLQPLLFNGRRYDPETGWYYYRTRYMDPRAGRFSSRDTIGIWGDEDQAGSPYAFCANNPSTRTDAFGTKVRISPTLETQLEFEIMVTALVLKMVPREDEASVTKAVTEFITEFTDPFELTGNARDGPKAVPRLLEALDDEKYWVREAAGIILKGMWRNDKVTAALQKKLKEKLPSLEVRRRIEKVLEGHDERWYEVNAVALSELVGELVRVNEWLLRAGPDPNRKREVAILEKDLKKARDAFESAGAPRHHLLRFFKDLDAAFEGDPTVPKLLIDLAKRLEKRKGLAAHIIISNERMRLDK